jgi:hypothetical protein
MSTKAERPIPTNAAKARVHRFAEDVASQLQFMPGNELEPLVAKLGGQI